MTDQTVVPIVYIAGVGRSGSTVLDRLLGECSGFQSGGELDLFWRYALVENRICSCGVPARECRFWGAVIDRIGFDQDGDPLLAEFIDDQLRTRRIPRLATARGRTSFAASVPGRWLDRVAHLYRAIIEVSGASVVVDSSKHPVYLYLLSRIAGIRLSVVHLVRDPRAVAFSFSRMRIEPGSGTYMNRFSPSETSAIWVSWNLAVRRVCDAARIQRAVVRYEDVVEDRLAVHRALSALMDLRSTTTTDKLCVVENHQIGGNPGRFRGGPVVLSSDVEWQTAMTWRDRALVSTLTLPLLAAYGYPLSGVRSPTAMRRQKAQRADDLRPDDR